MTERASYAESGVNIDIETKAAKILFEASKRTWANRTNRLGEVTMPFDDFSGTRFSRVEGLAPGTVTNSNSDGIGSKIWFAEQSKKFHTLGFDLLAMVCDDAVIRGGEPVHVKSVLTVNTLGNDDERLNYIHQLAEGYEKAANEAGVAIIGGELAQHPNLMGDNDEFHLDWNGDVIWFGNESRILTGSRINPGDFIVGLREEGLRSNGSSLIRRIFTREYINNWQNVMINGQPLGKLVLTPSRIYSKAVVDMFGGWSTKRNPKAIIHGAAHITGGGIPEKLGRALRPKNLGALIDNPFAPSPLMLHAQELGNVSDREAYRTWNMGQGMLIITPEPESVITTANQHGIEAKRVGLIKEAPGIIIESKGLNQEELTYN